jgi:hypothetical protein
MISHVRDKTYRAARTSRNAAVAHHLDEQVRTICGARVTSVGVRFSDCVRAGKLTKWFESAECLCEDCRRIVESGASQ